MKTIRAAVRRGGMLICDEIAEVLPGPGQTLVKTLRCGMVGLSGVATAFTALADPETQVKIVVDPTRL